MLQSILAYQVYISSVLLFVAQLLPLPAHFVRAEEQACAALFKGPSDWITVEALKDLSSLHFPVNLPDIPSMAMAARARVARFENAAHGALRVRRRPFDGSRSYQLTRPGLPSSTTSTRTASCSTCRPPPTR